MVLAVEDNDIQHRRLWRQGLWAGKKATATVGTLICEVQTARSLALTRAAGLAGTLALSSVPTPRRPSDAEAKTLSGRALCQSWGKAKRLSHQGCIRALHWPGEPGWPGCMATRPVRMGTKHHGQLACSR